MKRFLGILLTITMVITMLPGFTLTASAAEYIHFAYTDTNNNGAQDDGEPTWDNLSDALSAGGIVRMTMDMTIPHYNTTDPEKYQYIGMSSGTAMLDLNGFTLGFSSMNYKKAFDLSGSANLTVTNSKSDGLLFFYGVANSIYVSGSAKLTFAGGTVRATNRTATYFGISVSKSGSAVFQITGGSYNTNPTEHIPPSYKVVRDDSQEYNYTVLPIAANEVIAWQDTDDDGVIDTGEAVFNDIKNAVEFGGLIKLNCSFYRNTASNLTNPPDVTKDTVLDLNGYTYTATARSINVSSGTLTVRDSRGGGVLQNTGEGYSLISVSGGTLSVESGTLLSPSEYNLFRYGGTISLIGGSYNFEPNAEYLPGGYAAGQRAEDGLWDVRPDGGTHSTVTLSESEFIYDGTAKTPAVTVTDRNGTLTQDIDYIVAYNNNTAVGTGTVTVTFIGDYRGTATKEFAIQKLEASASLTGSIPLPAGGTTTTVTLSATLDSTDVTEDTEWSLAGTYTGVSISGNAVTVSSDAVPGTSVTVKGMYKGAEVSVSFALAKNPLPVFSISSGGFIYNGNEQKPTVTVSGLTEGTDYTVSYLRGDTVTDDFTNAGTITIQVTGMGNFDGIRTQTYTIHPMNINSTTFSLPQATYNGMRQEPELTVTWEGSPLVEGQDYVVETDPTTPDYTNVGDTQLRVKGIGNYSSQLACTYTISKKSISKEDVKLTSATTVWNGSEQKPAVTVSGVLESDYTVTYKRDDKETADFTSCGTITVTVSAATDNCVNTVNKEYVIGHTQDYSCCGGAGFALKYQASPDALPEYTNNLEYLKKAGTVTLMRSLSFNKYVVNDSGGVTTLVMNGHSITFGKNYYYSNTKGKLIVDATAGGAFHAAQTSEYSQTLLCQNDQLKIIGNLEFDARTLIKSSDEAPIDLTEYTGEGLIIYNSLSSIQQKPLLPAGYGIRESDKDGLNGELIADGTIKYLVYGKVVKTHTHDWNYTANGSTITATCTAEGCHDTNGGTVTIAAPANLEYTGNAIKAIVTDNRVDKTTTVNVVYTPADKLTEGNPVNPGEYTATVTLGTVTVSKTFTIKPPIFTVIATASPTEGGTVTGNGDYEYSTSVTVTATANKCYKFVNWTENSEEVSTDAIYTFTSLANRNLVANFEVAPPEELTSHTYTNGICIGCGAYVPATDENNDGIYEISNAGHLLWFADFVNKGNYAVSAKLMADIDMTDVAWTPIASTALYYNANPTEESEWGYKGIFDGNGKVIKNLTMTGSSEKDASFGLFGTLSGTVKNLGIENFKYTGAGKDTRVGAVVGQILGGTVENCFVRTIDINTKVNTTTGVAGGIAGCNYGGTVKNSYVHDILSISAGRAGDIVGDNFGDGNSSNGTDRPGTVINCYSSSYGGPLTNGDRVGNVENSRHSVSTAMLENGSIVWLLNEKNADGIWKQGNSFPEFSGTKVEKAPIDNYEAATLVTEENYESLGLTSDDVGAYAIANKSQMFWYSHLTNFTDNTAKAVLTADIDLENEEWMPIGTGPYKYEGSFDGKGHSIKNFKMTATFRGDYGLFGDANGVTVKNFTISGNVTSNRTTKANANLYYGSIIAYCSGNTTISNVHSSVNYTSIDTAYRDDKVGGLVGHAKTGGKFTVDGCSFSGILNVGVSDVDCLGGIVSYMDYNLNASINNTAFYGEIICTHSGTEQTGGVIAYHRGQNLYMQNCLSVGTITVEDYELTGAFLGILRQHDTANSKIKNNYYKSGNAFGNSTAGDDITDGRGGQTAGGSAALATETQLASGEIAYKLGSAWGQNIGTDTYPVLGGKKVCASEDAYFNINDFEIATATQNEAKALVTLKIPEAGTYSLIILDYEGDKLNEMEIITQKFDAGVVTATSTKDITLNKGDKIMLWSDMTNLVPKCEAYIAE